MSKVKTLTTKTSSNTSHHGSHPSQEIVKLNVGGTIFQTSNLTLTSERDSYFSNLLSGKIPCDKDEMGCYYIDRNPEVFVFILDYLRNPTTFPSKIQTMNSLQREYLKEESDFYQLQGLLCHLREWKHIQTYNFSLGPGKPICIISHMPHDKILFIPENHSSAVIMSQVDDIGLEFCQEFKIQPYRYRYKDVAVLDGGVIALASGNTRIYEEGKFLKLDHTWNDLFIAICPTTEPDCFLVTGYKDTLLEEVISLFDFRKDTIEVIFENTDKLILEHFQRSCIMYSKVEGDNKLVYVYQLDPESHKILLIVNFFVYDYKNNTIQYLDGCRYIRIESIPNQKKQILHLCSFKNFLSQSFPISVSDMVIKSVLLYDSQRLLVTTKAKDVKFFLWNFVTNQVCEMYFVSPHLNFEEWSGKLTRITKLNDGSLLFCLGSSILHWKLK